MKHYFEEYCSAQNSILNNKQKIIKNHITHYEVLEDMLGFQYFLNRKFTEYYNSIQDKTTLQKFLAPLSVHLLFSYNFQSLQTAFMTLECDFIHQAATTLRTVYESIPKMYYISLFPEEIGKITIYEYIHNLKYEQALVELKEKEYQSFLNNQELIFETNGEFQNFKRDYSPSGFRKKLYTKERQKLLQKLYSKFSSSTHPNIRRNETSVDYDSKNTELFFEFLKSLSYFNIEAYLEGNYQLLHEIKLEHETIDFLNNISSKFKTIYDDVYFFPDKSDLGRKLKTSSK